MKKMAQEFACEYTWGRRWSGISRTQLRPKYGNQIGSCVTIPLPTHVAITVALLISIFRAILENLPWRCAGSYHVWSFVHDHAWEYAHAIADKSSY